MLGVLPMCGWGLQTPRVEVRLGVQFNAGLRLSMAANTIIIHIWDISPSDGEARPWWWGVLPLGLMHVWEAPVAWHAVPASSMVLPALKQVSAVLIRLHRSQLRSAVLGHRRGLAVKLHCPTPHEKSRAYNGKGSQLGKQNTTG